MQCIKNHLLRQKKQLLIDKQERPTIAELKEEEAWIDLVKGIKEENKGGFNIS